MKTIRTLVSVTQSSLDAGTLLVKNCARMMSARIKAVAAILLIAGLVISAVALMNANASAPEEVRLLPAVADYTRDIAESAGGIPDSRKIILDEVAGFIAMRRAEGKPAALTFICTHNSRRSQFGQVWAAVAARVHGLGHVTTFSGGTEVTACNPRTVAALQRAGLEISATATGDNPRYEARFAPGAPPLHLHSKLYRAGENPQKDYAAMMCCSDADAKCPVVFGAADRFSLNYDDPKSADGTPHETARYDERCRQIAAEMFYVMARAAGL